MGVVAGPDPASLPKMKNRAGKTVVDWARWNLEVLGAMPYHPISTKKPKVNPAQYDPELSYGVSRYGPEYPSMRMAGQAKAALSSQPAMKQPPPANQAAPNAGNSSEATQGSTAAVAKEKCALGLGWERLTAVELRSFSPDAQHCCVWAALNCLVAMPRPLLKVPGLQLLAAPLAWGERTCLHWLAYHGDDELIHTVLEAAGTVHGALLEAPNIYLTLSTCVTPAC